jgi:hypothetical protein
MPPLYLDPKDPRFAAPLVFASGPGIHTDEASAALPDIAGLLPLADARALARASGTPLPPPAVRANPTKKKGGKKKGPPKRARGDDESVTSRDELFQIALLTTGTWGSGGEPVRRVLPILNPVPLAGPGSRPRVPLDFWARMELLRAEIAALTERVEQRYDRLGAGRIRPWLRELAKMAAAVDYVLAQRALPPAERSILAEVPYGNGSLKRKLPFGMSATVNGVPNGLSPWGVLAESGNTKLPFVSYSELPMATCPGAGKCGINYDATARSAELDRMNRERRTADAAPLSAADIEVINTERRLAGRPEITPAEVAALNRERARRRTAPIVQRSGWCYSFKSWRYINAFARQFLNTLANYADREFAIERGGASSRSSYDERVRAAIRGGRQWMQYVKTLIVRATLDKRRAGKRTFMRLFVDGDINYEDCILEWFAVCVQIGPSTAPQPEAGRDIGPGERHVDVYGYSKCWSQFLNVARNLHAHPVVAGHWPANYALNLSSGSVHETNEALRAALVKECEPIVRGPFVAIDLHAYIGALEEQTELFRRNPKAVVPLTKLVRERGPTPWKFSRRRIRTFLLINGAQSVEELRAIHPLLADFQAPQRANRDALVRAAYKHYLTRLVAERASFGALVRTELARDADESGADVAYWNAYRRRQRAALQRLIDGQPLSAEEQAEMVMYEPKQVLDKALALALHEVLWTFGLGGSCPLICGSCSSDPAGASADSMHRCADTKGLFKGVTVHIGLHVLPLLFTLATLAMLFSRGVAA